MAFPQTILPIKTELLLAGTWTDISTYTRGDGTGALTVTRGYSGEQSNQSPGSCAFTLDNTDNRFNNRNPLSPYYRQLPRNVQFRASIDTGIVSARYIDMASARAYDGSTIWTADKASLDVVGDLELVADVEAEDWRGRRGQLLIAKYVRAGNQRSFALSVDPDGYPTLIWTVDGTTATLGVARCPNPISPSGRIALRAQLQVNNGAGGWTTTFATAATATSSFTTLGTVSNSGTTSIFSSSARLEIGTVDNGAGWSAGLGGGVGDADPFVGRYYRAIVRNGIGGTTVADMNATAQTAGTTSWSDGLAAPNTWTVTGSSYLTSADYRFWGEVPSLPRRADTSVTDVYVPTRAADVLQRLTSGSGNKPLESPVKRNLKQFAWDGYWPCEDMSTATTAAAYYGQNAIINNCQFAAGNPSGFLGSAGSLIASDDTATAVGHCAKSTGTPSQTTDLLYFQFSTAPPSATYIPFIRFYHPGGTGYVVTLSANNVNYLVEIRDSFGASLVSVATVYTVGQGPTTWTAMRMKLSNVSTTITWEFAWYPVNAPSPLGTSGTYTGVMGRPDSWSWPAWTGKSGAQIAHVSMGRLDPGITSSDFTGSTNAYVNETWDVRARRLADEEGIPLFLRGVRSRDGSNTLLKAMGPQSESAIVPLLQECAEVAGGQLYAPRDKFGLTIASWEIMANRTDGSQLKLDYAAAQLSGSVEPEPDDFLVENDVTLTTAVGNSYRYVKTAGSLNANQPGGTDPDAVGTYDVVASSPSYTPDDLAALTQRRVLFGTWDEDRYPAVQAELTRAPFTASAALTAAVRATDITRPLSIVNPGAWLAADQINLMISGYTETLGQKQHTFQFNTRPYGPWVTGIWGSSSFVTPSLWAPESSTLSTGYAAGATSIVISTPDVYEVWAYASNFNLWVAGEVMTVTAISARSGTGPYTYTLTVTRAVNSISKAQLANEPIYLVNAGRWA